MQKGLQLASYIAPDVPEAIEADPVRLSQVLSNLIGNALKFTEQGGVLVRLERVSNGDASRLRFSVADSGIGIASDKLAAIFDPFTQAEQSTTRRFGGTGIGLTISRRLVDAMGGTLNVQSQLGAGSVFSFEIACEATASLPVAASRHRGSALLMVTNGPLRTALELASADLGLLSCSRDPNSVPASVPGDVHIVILPADARPDLLAFANDTGAPVVALSRFGDANAERLVREGHVRDIIELPLGSRAARATITAVLEGGAPIFRAEPASERDASGERPFAGKCILAADDSAINREVLHEALIRLGADVSFVEDGAAAVSAVQQGRFDLIFMDGSMPVMDGFTAARAIRDWEVAHQRTSVPIVGLSAHVFRASDESWRIAGMTDFIAKPFTLAAIRSCLDRWLVSHPQGGEPAETVQAAGAIEAAPCQAATLIDPDVLGEIAAMQATGDVLVGRVVRLYIEHAPRALDHLAARFAQPEDGEALAAAAHALKSLCRNIGAIHLGNLCGEIERGARKGIAPPDTALREVEATLRDTIAELRRLHPPADARPRRTA